jgi:hypothetical protein
MAAHNTPLVGTSNSTGWPTRKMNRPVISPVLVAGWYAVLGL